MIEKTRVGAKPKVAERAYKLGAGFDCRLALQICTNCDKMYDSDELLRTALVEKYNELRKYSNQNHEGIRSLK